MCVYVYTTAKVHSANLGRYKHYPEQCFVVPLDMLMGSCRKENRRTWEDNIKHTLKTWCRRAWIGLIWLGVYSDVRENVGNYLLTGEVLLCLDGISSV